MPGYPYFISEWSDKVNAYTPTAFDKPWDENMAFTFEQWLLFTADNSFQNINNHFKPIGFFCAPCELDFHYISYTETLGDAMLDGFDKGMKNDTDRQFLADLKDHRQEYSALRPYKSHQNAKEAFLDISSRNKSLVLEIYEKYKWDFKLFGYVTDGYIS